MVEFAIAWPLCLLLVVGCIQLSIWSAERYSAREAALAGARAATSGRAGPELAATVTIAALGRSLVGARPANWCPGSVGAQPDVWVCATEAAGIVEVRVGGSVPSLVPLLPGGRGLPVSADIALVREVFR